MSTNPVIDIKKSSTLPWWFFTIGALAFALMSWAARGVTEWLDVCIWIFVASLGLVIAGQLLLTSQRRSADWYRNLNRLACAAMVAAAAGFLIRYYFAAGSVYVENATDLNLKIALDGNDWLELPAFTVKKVPMPVGTHVVAAHMVEGDKKLDEHRVAVDGCNNYVLNVLGAQTYLHGVVVYGAKELPRPEIITDKWFELRPVDFLFRDPPETVGVQRREGAMPPLTRKTYFIRAKVGGAN